jgi:hypothetical protein
MLSFIAVTLTVGIIGSVAFTEGGAHRPYGSMGTNAGPERHLV